MVYYLHICKDKTNKLFLLISEQKTDGITKGIQIKAQIYFSHPPTKLDSKSTELEAVTLPIAKKEVANILELAQTRQAATHKPSVGLFAKGKISKDDPFRVFSFPTTQKISELLKQAHLQLPKKEAYATHTLKQDEDHELEHKHSLVWQTLPKVTTREEASINNQNWSPLELQEANLLHTQYFIHQIFTRHSDKINNEVSNKYNAYIDQLKGLSDQYANLADSVKAGDPDAKKFYIEARTDLHSFVEVSNNYFLAELGKQSKLKNNMELEQAQLHAVPDDSSSQNQFNRP